MAIAKATGNLSFRSSSYYFNNSAGTENCLDIVQNGAVSLYYDHVEKFKTRSDGAGTPDATALFFGASDDLKITESGGNGLIDAQTGTLYLDAEAHIS